MTSTVTSATTRTAVSALPTPRTPAADAQQRTGDDGDAIPDLLAAAGLPVSGRYRLGSVLRGDAGRLADPLARLALGFPLPAQEVPEVLVACRRGGSAARVLGLRTVAGQLAALDEQLVAEPSQALPDPALAARLRAQLVAHLDAHLDAHAAADHVPVAVARRP